MNLVQNEYPSIPTTMNPQPQLQPGMQSLQQFTIPKMAPATNGQHLVPQVVQNSDGTHSVHFVTQQGPITKSNSLPNLDGMLLFDYATDTDSSSESSFQVSMAPSTSQAPIQNYNTMEAHIQQNSNKRPADTANEQQAQKKKKKMPQPNNAGILAQTPPCQA
jgi:hypothetical protein